MSEFLLPKVVISQYSKVDTREQAQEIFQKIAESYNVSEPLVAYRFLRRSKITKALYEELRSAYAVRLKAKKELKSTENKGKNGGPDYYDVKRNHLGNVLCEFVDRAIRSGDLTYTKAAKLLRAKVTSVNKTMLA